MKTWEILVLAEKAGIGTVLPAPNGQVEAIVEFARLIRAKEREACENVIKEIHRMEGKPVPCCVIPETDWSGKCFKCRKQLFERGEDD
jgi:hypothetical protein